VNWKSILILTAAALALTTGSAGANESSHYYIAKGSVCVASPKGPLVRVKMLMYADPFLQTHVTNFVLNARLIPHGATLPGQNWTRTWAWTKFALVGGASHKLIMSTFVPTLDPQYDWDIQVKMQWKRPAPRGDWSTTLVVKFHKERCPAGSFGPADPQDSSAGGSSLPDQSTPNVNGG
jgi:hypothetical protein